MRKEPLPLSPAQQDRFNKFGAKPRQLFRWLARAKLRPNVLSFAWKLLHHRLYLHTVDTCPFCDEQKPNTEHVFNNCPTLLHTHTATLISTTPTIHHQNTRALFTCWAIWKVMWAIVYQGPRPNDVIVKMIQSVVREETQRIMLATQ